MLRPLNSQGYAMTYAVIKTGGKQYRVSAGQTIRVEKLEGKKGDAIELDQVLLFADGEALTVGRPLCAGIKVKAEILDQDRHAKVVIFKYRRRKRYRRKTGHRQPFTALKIVDILQAQASA
jgi:large subunit ribosomal protein L21